jgi:hypothetical protein
VFRNGLHLQRIPSAADGFAGRGQTASPLRRIAFTANSVCRRRLRRFAALHLQRIPSAADGFAGFAAGSPGGLDLEFRLPQTGSPGGLDLAREAGVPTVDRHISGRAAC